MRPRVLERVGRVLRFSPEGREVRVWVRGMPGADETEVVAGLLTDVSESRAVLTLRPPEGASRVLRVEPHEAGWGFHALWFSFISVDVFEGDGGDPVGRWFIRLGSP
jgi:hypothetical protein